MGEITVNENSKPMLISKASFKQQILPAFTNYGWHFHIPFDKCMHTTMEIGTLKIILRVFLLSGYEMFSCFSYTHWFTHKCLMNGKRKLLKYMERWAQLRIQEQTHIFRNNCHAGQSFREISRNIARPRRTKLKRHKVYGNMQAWFRRWILVLVIVQWIPGGFCVEMCLHVNILMRK